MTTAAQPIAAHAGPVEKSLPRLTVIIPCRNEEQFISQCLDSILRSDYPTDRYEIIVADGMSTDRTRPLVQKYCRKHANIRLLDNLKGTTPAGLNIGIRAAVAATICRVDAHARISRNYLRRCVESLCDGAAENVGGSMRTIPSKPTLMARSIAFCMSHKFGAGNSAFRTGSNEPAFTDTVFGGCYRKVTLERLGLFNERLERTQDFELNQRLRKSGGRILLDPAITCDYFASPNLHSFVRKNLRDGAWSIRPFAYSNVMPVRARHLICLAFVAASVVLLACGVWLRPLWTLLMVELAAYLVALLAFSIQLSWRERNPCLLFTMSLVFCARHCAYGFGSLIAAIRLPGDLMFTRRNVFQ